MGRVLRGTRSQTPRSVTGQKGQALLIVVLVMIVVLTISLSVALKTVTNQRTSTEEENSARAFSAAEAGVEKVLKSGQPIPTPEQFASNKAQYTVKIVGILGADFIFNAGLKVMQDEGGDLWLADYVPPTNPLDHGNYTNPRDSSFRVYWSVDPDDCNSVTAPMAALEVIAISRPDPATNMPISTRSVFDPCLTRRNGNKFEAPEVGSALLGRSFKNRTRQIDVKAGLFVRIRPLYADSVIGIQRVGGSQFPSQGQSIQSLGTAGQTQRKIILFKGYPKISSEFFPYILFSTR